MRPDAFWFIAACCLVAAPRTHAQTAASPAPAASAPRVPATGAASAASAVPAVTNVPVNGYAENLRPARRAVAGASAGRPYEPVRKVDDEGQIPEIEMFVGESRVFPTPGVARIAVGNGTALTAAALDGREVILFANAAGTSSLFIWNGDGRYQRVKISIVPGDTTRAAREIAAFLSAIPHAKASIVGANIIVEGDDLSDVDLSKIDDLARRYPQIVNFTNKVGWEQMVLMDVKVVEFPITYLREIGLKWNATGGGAFGAIWSPTRVGSAGPYQVNLQTGTANPAPISAVGGGGPVIPSALNVLSYLNLGLNAQLDLLAQDGKSTMLAEPQLSARNGSKASFTVGGELPYSVQTRDGTAVLFKEYGVKLDITPKVDHRGVIRATIHAEVSSIDASVSTAYGPALLTRKADTEFNVRSGETIVLAGLLQRDTSTTIEKVPLLGDIPVLGALFRSKRFQNKETEMVVFVTPSLNTARSAGNVDRIDRANERLEERLGASPYLTEPLQSGIHYERPNAVPPRPASAPEGSLPAAVEPVAYLSANGSRAPVVSAADAVKLAGGGATVGGGVNTWLRVLAARVPLRSEPRATAPTLLQLERGAAVEAGRSGARVIAGSVWRHVLVGTLDGWVPAGALAPVGGAYAGSFDAGSSTAGDRVLRRPLGHAADRPVGKPLTLDGPLPDARSFKVAKDGQTLRVTPDINGEVVGRPAMLDTVVGLPYAPRGVWMAVQWGTGESALRGWIESQWLIPATP
jgi:pilus assembly protein CpaC